MSTQNFCAMCCVYYSPTTAVHRCPAMQSTERLAQAERERDESARALNNCWDHKVRVLKELDAMRDERDAALAEESKWRERWVKDVAAMQRQRDAALAKAEEWENCAGTLESERLALRARIQALADDMEVQGAPVGWPPRLRALLKPATPETALDVLERIESEWNSLGTATGDANLSAALAKLRKLLEDATLRD